jgi:hypothetical protein
MDAEELRDAVLSVAGDLDDAVGGPSEDLTPANKRRTVYGKVSRYKLDTYLQTFDFPPPNISAEKRFATTVPLQRLFLMNSDFMQVEAEDLAKRVAAEADNHARIRKIYQLVYARDPSVEEMNLGLDYLHTEPLKEYEENKKKPQEGGRRGGRGGAKPEAAPATPETGGKPEPPVTGKVAPATDPVGDPASTPAAEGVAETATGTGAAPETDAATPAADNADMGMGMMDGVPGFGGRRGNRGGAAAEVKYDPTAWGRYAKILLSSSEFLFIN